MGSVKDLKVTKPPKENKLGSGHFIFSDRYSVFDWGEMPDHIPHKGESLCILTSYFFEKMENKNINSHYQGVIKNGEKKKLDLLKKPVNTMAVSLVNVIEPDYHHGKYDYSAYNENLNNCLIPLEIIYRNTLPQHSSFRKRYEKGEINLKEYGLEQLPAPGKKLENPIYDVSTKLEASDRYISWKEAQTIAGLTDKEIENIQYILSEVNNLISREVEKTGMENLDGKIELAFGPDREIMVVDAVGTPDECRFAYNSFSISKEAVRKYYRNSEWYQEVTQAKKTENPEWRKLVDKDPEPLPRELLELISQMYQVCANEITGKKWYDNVFNFTTIEEKLSKFN